jgi:hypothetical protein
MNRRDAENAENAEKSDETEGGILILQSLCALCALCVSAVQSVSPREQRRSEERADFRALADRAVGIARRAPKTAQGENGDGRAAGCGTGEQCEGIPAEQGRRGNEGDDRGDGQCPCARVLLHRATESAGVVGGGQQHDRDRHDEPGERGETEDDARARRSQWTGEERHLETHQQHDADHAERPGAWIARDEQALRARALHEDGVAQIDQPVQVEEPGQECQRRDEQHGDDERGERGAAEPGINQRERPAEQVADRRIPRDRRAVIACRRRVRQRHAHEREEGQGSQKRQLLLPTCEE